MLVVVTHGNGPQIGLLALQGEAYRDVASYPLDVLGAESDGMIGYLLDPALVNRLAGARPVATSTWARSSCSLTRACSWSAWAEEASPSPSTPTATCAESRP